MSIMPQTQFFGVVLLSLLLRLLHFPQLRQQMMLLRRYRCLLLAETVVGLQKMLLKLLLASLLHCMHSLSAFICVT